MIIKDIIRKITLKILRLFGRNITIKHHYTGDKIKLHSFSHKGYWFHGKKREANTMLSFAKLITANNFIVEVGGHIGYLTLYFSKLANNGKVVVFEPGINNLPYLISNVRNKKNVRIVQKGVGNETGQKKFYIEALTGQNNTFVKDFDVFEQNKKNAGMNQSYKEITVDIVRLDDFLSEENYPMPQLIKIDVEGFEFQVLSGMRAILGMGKTTVMVEIQADYRAIYDLMMQNNYGVYNDQLQPLNGYTEYLSAPPNRFFIPNKI
jgi:FkbM family methyltransferase